MFSKVEKHYRIKLDVSHHTESLNQYLPKLRSEIGEGRYVLPEIRYLLSSPPQTLDVFRTSTVELRVVGATTRDHWMCRKVCQRVCAVQAVYPTKPESLVVWVFLTSAKRVMPSPPATIEPKHINGGYTYIRGNEIYVLRREEFPKVVLHEVIHHTQHHNSNWSDASIAQLYDTFHISRHNCSHPSDSMDSCSTVLEPNEAVVEAWAEMLQLLFVSIDYKIPFHDVYSAELEHAFQKAKKILYHQWKYVPEWHESTHAYSYIVLRTLLLATFQVWCELRDPSALASHIMKTWGNPDLQDRLKKTKIDNSKSLRMTLYGDM